MVNRDVDDREDLLARMNAWLRQLDDCLERADGVLERESFGRGSSIQYCRAQVERGIALVTELRMAILGMMIRPPEPEIAPPERP